MHLVVYGYEEVNLYMQYVINPCDAEYLGRIKHSRSDLPLYYIFPVLTIQIRRFTKRRVSQNRTQQVLKGFAIKYISPCCYRTLYPVFIGWLAGVLS